MIVPDINLLLYAYDADSPFHLKAAAWWASCLSASEPVGLPLVVLFGFVRIGTNARVFKNPMAPAEASQHVRSWLAQPVAQILEPSRDNVAQVFGLLDSLGTAGNLVTDAQIAALVIEHNGVLHTNDTDFSRFVSLRHFNPLTRGARTRQHGG